MSNKNPFELRFDVLKMAKEMMDKSYDTQMQLAYSVMEQYKDNAEQALEAWQRYVPKMYTPDEVKAQAEKLYEFVTEKGDK